MRGDDDKNEAEKQAAKQQAAEQQAANIEKQKSTGAATSAAIQQVQEETAVNQAKQAVTEEQSKGTEDTQYVGEPLVIDEGVCAIGSANQQVIVKETKKDEKKSSQPQLDPSDPNYMLTCKASDFKQIAKNIKKFQEDKAKAGQKQEKVLITGAKDPGKVIKEIDMLDNGAYISEATIDFDDKTKSKKSYKENKVGGKLKKLNIIVKTKKETNKNVEKLNKYGIKTPSNKYKDSKKYQDGYNMLLKASQYGKDIPKQLKLKINAHFGKLPEKEKAILYGHFLATSRNIDQEGNTLTNPTAKVENTKKRSKAIIETKVGLRFIDDDNLKIKKAFIGLVDNTIKHQGAALDVIDKVETVKSIVDSAVGDTVNKLTNQAEITPDDITNFKKTLISMDDNINTVVGNMEADIVTMKISGEELVKAGLIEKPVPTKIDGACTSTTTTMSGGFMFKLKSKVKAAKGKGHQLITTLRTYNAGKESKGSKSVKEMVADMERFSPVKLPSSTTYGQIPVPHSSEPKTPPPPPPPPPPKVVAPKPANNPEIDNLVQTEGVNTVISPLTEAEAKPTRPAPSPPSGSKQPDKQEKPNEVKKTNQVVESDKTTPKAKAKGAAKKRKRRIGNKREFPQLLMSVDGEVQEPETAAPKTAATATATPKGPPPPLPAAPKGPPPPPPAPLKAAIPSPPPTAVAPPPPPPVPKVAAPEKAAPEKAAPAKAAPKVETTAKKPPPPPPLPAAELPKQNKVEKTQKVTESDKTTPDAQQKTKEDKKPPTKFAVIIRKWLKSTQDQIRTVVKQKIKTAKKSIERKASISRNRSQSTVPEPSPTRSGATTTRPTTRSRSKSEPSQRTSRRSPLINLSGVRNRAASFASAFTDFKLPKVSIPAKRDFQELVPSKGRRDKRTQDKQDKQKTATVTSKNSLSLKPQRRVSI